MTIEHQVLMGLDYVNSVSLPTEMLNIVVFSLIFFTTS